MVYLPAKTTLLLSSLAGSAYVSGGFGQIGDIISKARLLLQAGVELSKTYDLLEQRIQAPPGLPVPNPTVPFWTDPPAVVATAGEPLPEYADVVVIGTGITGTSIAYNLLEEDDSLMIVMLEARDVCSGATARNGGHINAPLYHDYSQLKDLYGEHVAQVMIRFRLEHMRELRRVAAAEDLVEVSQIRDTEHLDVYATEESFEEAKENLALWKNDMAVEASGFDFYERNTTIEKYRLGTNVIGCIENPGGAMHPYRFVTSLLKKLLARYPSNLHIATDTPCTTILGPSSESSLYTLSTPNGHITTPHVIHATNGWASHLLTGLRAKVIPSRGMMTAQRPGTSLAPSTLNGNRSYVFYRDTAGYDYLTQLPSGEHELMFGGGWAVARSRGLPEIGFADDSTYNFAAAAHLEGVLPLYFGLRNWGTDKVPNAAEAGRWAVGRAKAHWSGVLGISVDMLPWVGRVPTSISGRTEPAARACMRGEESAVGLAPPGEWVSAGYSGEGMVHAWMSGKALAYMVLGRENEIEEWFPDILRVTEKRWKETSVDHMISRFMSS